MRMGGSGWLNIKQGVASYMSTFLKRANFFRWKYLITSKAERPASVEAIETKEGVILETDLITVRVSASLML
jgi:hypothetical protein